MYAIFRAGGHQYRADKGATVRIPVIAAEIGETVTFEDVLLAADGEDVQVGEPTLSGAKIKAEVVKHGRGRKIIVFKRKRRKTYRRKQGHRQGFTEVRIKDIVV